MAANDKMCQKFENKKQINGMKKSELKRLLSQKEIQIEQFIIREKKLVEQVNFWSNIVSQNRWPIKDYSSPQAGDKIVKTDNSDWFIKNDDGTYTIKLDPSIDISRWLKVKGGPNATAWNEPEQNDFDEQEEINRANYEDFKQRGKEFKQREAQNEHPDYVCIDSVPPEIKRGDIFRYQFDEKIHDYYYQNVSSKSTTGYDPEFFTNNYRTHFEVYQPKKATPLTDLANEVEIEKEANELIEHFMPLVNGWVSQGESTFSSCGGKIWLYCISEQRKAAIGIAIKHCELNMILPLTSKHFDALKSQLQKMLSE